ncbi:MAG: flavin reductase family protein [Methanobrevibacter sp.]|uniref:flavin reductase family protein n=1 Tax=Methanobrevibacter sp. TaxID=66852 RepID=UPI0026DFA773|nr:flavin reductase family protein [Methanobrevibacter sp.]MDO5848280.1 flavin reductase family protein [Methanobrevibacter sp.]
MKKQLETKMGIFPMPVLMIATYNDDDTVNVMNAAWGTMKSRDQIILELGARHKTMENIRQRNAFTVSLADADHVVEADYFGIVSGNDTEDKFEKSKMTAVKSEIVDAPIINEFPICMECELVEIKEGEFGCDVVGDVLSLTADEDVLTEGKVDISKLNAIAFDPFTLGYYKIGERVGNAYKDGAQLK